MVDIKKFQDKFGKHFGSQEFIKELEESEELQKFIKILFPKARLHELRNLIRQLAIVDKQFSSRDISDSFDVRYLDFFEKGVFKRDLLVEFQDKFYNYIEEMLDSKRLFEEGDECGEVYVVKKSITFERLRKKICDNVNVVVKFKYNFDKPDLVLQAPTASETLQHCKIQILSSGITFDYPLEFKYYCSKCGQEDSKKAYEVASSRTNISCCGEVDYTTAAGEPRSKPCNYTLSPDINVSKVRIGYFYEIGFEDNGEKKIGSCIGLEQYKPGYYECVMFKMPTPGKTEMFFLVDVKKIPSNKLKLPKQLPNENYLFTLQKHLDDYIKDKTGVEIYGLNPIKVALILQTALRVLGERLVGNVMIVGDPSTGKSMLLKYYSFLLNNYYNMSTNGLSISIAGLRGTRSNINLFGKDIKIVTIGHLGNFHSIHIDEAGENKELVQNLKSFLLEDNYSYDRAGSTGVSNKRTSHVNLSQNLDYEHVGQYRGAIRKAYKELNLTIGGVEKVEWQEESDLFLPLHSYDNPQLRKVVREKRLEFKQKQVFWLDGTDQALHERFPFYFFITNEKTNEDLLKVIKENSSRKIVSENLEIIRILYTEDLDNYFKDLIQFQYCEQDFSAYQKVDDIIKQYGLNFDSRMLNIYYMIVRMSRVCNKRMDYNQQDFDLIRWYLENTNIKIEVIETNHYTPKGPPNLDKEQTQLIEEETSKAFDEVFGLPPGDFT